LWEKGEKGHGYVLVRSLFSFPAQISTVILSVVRGPAVFGSGRGAERAGSAPSDQELGQEQSSRPPDPGWFGLVWLGVRVLVLALGRAYFVLSLPLLREQTGMGPTPGSRPRCGGMPANTWMFMDVACIRTRPGRLAGRIRRAPHRNHRSTCSCRNPSPTVEPPSSQKGAFSESSPWLLVNMESGNVDCRVISGGSTREGLECGRLLPETVLHTHYWHGRPTRRGLRPRSSESKKPTKTPIRIFGNCRAISPVSQVSPSFCFPTRPSPSPSCEYRPHTHTHDCQVMYVRVCVCVSGSPPSLTANRQTQAYQVRAAQESGPGLGNGSSGPLQAATDSCISLRLFEPPSHNDTAHQNWENILCLSQLLPLLLSPGCLALKAEA